MKPLPFIYCTATLALTISVCTASFNTDAEERRPIDEIARQIDTSSESSNSQPGSTHSTPNFPPEPHPTPITEENLKPPFIPKLQLPPAGPTKETTQTPSPVTAAKLRKQSKHLLLQTSNWLLTTREGLFVLTFFCAYSLYTDPHCPDH